MAKADEQNIAGAPLPSQTVDYKPMLDGLGETVVVAVHNPLATDFRVQYARSVVQVGADSPHLSQEEKSVLDKGGILPRKDQNPQAHAIQYLVLRAGETMNLPGDIAQLAVRQLRTYIIQIRNKGRGVLPVSDPYAWEEVEKEIVISVSNNVDFFNNKTPEEYTDKQLDGLNKKDEAAKEAPNPPPGQGTNY